MNITTNLLYCEYAKKSKNASNGRPQKTAFRILYCTFTHCFLYPYHHPQGGTWNKAALNFWSI